MSPEDRQELNARRRSNRRVPTATERQEENARRRDGRRNLTDVEGQARRAQRNANDADRRNRPCAQSIAMPRPAAAVHANLSVRSHTSHVEATSPHASPSTSTPLAGAGGEGRRSRRRRSAVGGGDRNWPEGREAERRGRKE